MTIPIRTPYSRLTDRWSGGRRRRRSARGRRARPHHGRTTYESNERTATNSLFGYFKGSKGTRSRRRRLRGAPLAGAITLIEVDCAGIAVTTTARRPRARGETSRFDVKITSKRCRLCRSWVVVAERHRPAASEVDSGAKVSDDDGARGGRGVVWERGRVKAKPRDNANNLVKPESISKARSISESRMIARLEKRGMPTGTEDKTESELTVYSELESEMGPARSDGASLHSSTVSALVSSNITGSVTSGSPPKPLSTPDVIAKVPSPWPLAALLPTTQRSPTRAAENELGESHLIGYFDNSSARQASCAAAVGDEHGRKTIFVPFHRLYGELPKLLGRMYGFKMSLNSIRIFRFKMYVSIDADSRTPLQRSNVSGRDVDRARSCVGREIRWTGPRGGQAASDSGSV
ncbi:hypothetical protein EVAR_86178_1 [Eumeta japonica]|uniref:Uncharacterized protein n=1 Tax=Eumeta variegata TaxID=151549 RepID=A0A4C1UBG0_EUMVA|nr:hypothetical protein EVAR_86178_1 [Eumeta japonica]